jgi:hypothetical protein
MSKYKFEEQVKELFSGVYNYSENPKIGEVYFQIRYGFNAESLFALSDLLGTGSIHSSCDGSAGGGCPTCDGDLTTWITISASGVKF